MGVSEENMLAYLVYPETQQLQDLKLDYYVGRPLFAPSVLADLPTASLAALQGTNVVVVGTGQLGDAVADALRQKGVQVHSTPATADVASLQQLAGRLQREWGRVDALFFSDEALALAAPPHQRGAGSRRAWREHAAGSVNGAADDWDLQFGI
uniref:Uncharacterized protein n=1 Tax=Haptolina ericina TaxID=156174 RepID=A0A7S3F080_9EUKA